MQSERKEKKRKRKGYAVWRQFIEKPSMITGCPGVKRYVCSLQYNRK